MLKNQQFRVQFDDGREELVSVDGRDYMFYERESGENALELIREGNSFKSWYMMAAAAMRRQGLFTGTPDEFYNAVAFVIPVVDQNGSEPPEDEAPDPTTPETDLESSSSP